MQSVKTSFGAALLLAAGLVSIRAQAASIVDFDQFNDGTLLTTQVPGLVFTNTVVLTAGISLNEREVPPYSAPNVASDNGGPISIRFASPVSSFSGYFTYSVPLTLQEFDSNNNLIAAASSRFGSNLALSGDTGSSPNELLQILFVAPVAISRVTITGSTNGGSFALDDVSFQTIVPEPGGWSLLLLGLAGLQIARKRHGL